MYRCGSFHRTVGVSQLGFSGALDQFFGRKMITLGRPVLIHRKTALRHQARRFGRLLEFRWRPPNRSRHQRSRRRHSVHHHSRFRQYPRERHHPVLIGPKAGPIELPATGGSVSFFDGAGSPVPRVGPGRRSTGAAIAQWKPRSPSQSTASVAGLLQTPVAES